MRRVCPNIATAGDRPVDFERVFQMLRINLDSFCAKVTSLTFYNAHFNVRTALSANPFEFRWYGAIFI